MKAHIIGKKSGVKKPMGKKAMKRTKGGGIWNGIWNGVGSSSIEPKTLK
ncbi:MAG: hypothetical protein HY343_01665 [Lentisphaerae bacterium]|nr:hypothetical protein [Lentisphaerota bacterium]